MIGTCAVASEDVLSLTWWPLARDCAYYASSLIVLALLFSYVKDMPSGLCGPVLAFEYPPEHQRVP